MDFKLFPKKWEKSFKQHRKWILSRENVSKSNSPRPQISWRSSFHEMHIAHVSWIFRSGEMNHSLNSYLERSEAQHFWICYQTKIPAPLCPCHVMWCHLEHGHNRLRPCPYWAQWSPRGKPQHGTPKGGTTDVYLFERNHVRFDNDFRGVGPKLHPFKNQRFSMVGGAKLRFRQRTSKITFQQDHIFESISSMDTAPGNTFKKKIE